MADPPPLTSLTERQRAAALEQLALLRPYFEDGIPLPRLAHEQGIALRTARRWVQQYHQRGLAGLVRKARADRGQRRLPEQLQLLIEGLALRTPRPSAAAVHRQVAKVAAEHGWAPPSYATVYGIVRQIDPALATLAHQGTKAYKEAFDLLYRHEASRPNEIWQADHTRLDLWVLDHRDQPARPWLTVILDDYSRAIASYALSLQAPSALQTALALRHGIWRKAEPHWHLCGIPEIFYTDHGSDFTSRHLEQVAADLKMRLVFSEQGEPRGRGKIERFFETVNQLFLSELPGYAPRGTPRPVPALTLPALDGQLRAFLLDRYQQRVHRETGVAPQLRWEAGGFLPRLPETLEQLDLLLLTVATTRRIHQDGIHFQGMRYLDLTLAAYVGETVIIRYDPRDMAEIRVFYQDRFLCRAICQELAGQEIGLKEIVRARSERRRQLRADLTERASVVDTYLAPYHAAPTPADAEPPAAPAPRLKRYYNE